MVLAGGSAGGAAARARRTPTPTPSLESLQGGEKLHALVARVVSAQRELRSLRAHFRQTKKTALLLAPVSSTGTLSYLAPDRVRWDYQTPRPMAVIYADGVLTTVPENGGRVDRLPVPRKQRRFVGVLAGTVPLDDLISRFRVTLADPGPPAPYRLTLEPTHRVVRRRLKVVRLEVDRRLLLPVAVEYEEADGDSTAYRLARVAVDPPVAPELFVVGGSGVAATPAPGPAAPTGR